MGGNYLDKNDNIFYYGHKLSYHVKCFGFVITVTLIGLCLVVYFKLEAEFDILNYFYIFLAISIAPVIYLYCEYLFFNPKSASVKIETEARKVIISDRGASVEIGFDEIKEVILYRTPSWSRKDSVQMLPFEQFHYARISTVSETFILTCLLAEDVEKALESADRFNVIHRMRLFPSILLERFC